MSNIILANIVQIIHIIVVLFTFFTPFLEKVDWTILMLHVTTVVSLLTHWIFNQDTCFLTLVESELRGIKQENSFMYSIVSPIYKIKDIELKKIVMIVVPILGLISAIRLYKRWGSVKSDFSLIWDRL